LAKDNTTLAKWLEPSRSKLARLPVIFVYTVSKECDDSTELPSYIKYAIAQAIYTQPNSDVILASNFGDCSQLEQSVNNIEGLWKVDSVNVMSSYSLEYQNLTKTLFSAMTHQNLLWITASLRFFILQDIMLKIGYSEFIHLEADNLLYLPFDSILPVLRKNYPIGITPLTANLGAMTASIFYISSLGYMKEVTDFLHAIASNRNDMWKNYLQWVRRYECCKKGGIDPDPVTGMGIKPYGINEMTMLAFYRQMKPELMKLFPIVPNYAHYPIRRPFCNLNLFAPGGKEVGPPVPPAIFDSGSWGQQLGGTYSKKGRDKGFLDTAHIIGQSIILAKCRVEMFCTRNGSMGVILPANSTSALHLQVNPHIQHAHLKALEEKKEIDIKALFPLRPNRYECYTAPFAACHEDPNWIPLWNLHVHSKHTYLFISRPCDCQLLT
jgi:hypothetical protein